MSGVVGQNLNNECFYTIKLVGKIEGEQEWEISFVPLRYLKKAWSSSQELNCRTAI